MVSSTAKFLVVSGVVGAAVHAWAPVDVSHHRAIDGPSSRYARVRSHDVQLSYRPVSDEGGAEDGTTATARCEDAATTSLPLDLEQFQELKEFLREEATPAVTRELEGRPPIASARPITPSSRSDARSMFRDLAALALPSLGGLLLTSDVADVVHALN